MSSSTEVWGRVRPSRGDWRQQDFYRAFNQCLGNGVAWALAAGLHCKLVVLESLHLWDSLLCYLRTKSHAALPACRLRLNARGGRPRMRPAIKLFDSAAALHDQERRILQFLDQGHVV